MTVRDSTQDNKMQIEKVVPQNRRQGFTLIELMITVAIIAIISAIAIPSFNAQSKKAYRGEAKAALVQLASALERHRTVNNVYHGTGALAVHSGGVPASTFFPRYVPLDKDADKAMYNITITADTSSYTLTATPIAARKMAGDGIYNLSHTGIKSYSGTDTNDNWK